MLTFQRAQIFALGPIRDGLYEWATVTDGGSYNQLYVLVRDVGRFEAEFQEQVLSMLEDAGFVDRSNVPIPTNQEDCMYDVHG